MPKRSRDTDSESSSARPERVRRSDASALGKSAWHEGYTSTPTQASLNGVHSSTAAASAPISTRIVYPDEDYEPYIVRNFKIYGHLREPVVLKEEDVSFWSEKGAKPQYCFRKNGNRYLSGEATEYLGNISQNRGDISDWLLGRSHNVGTGDKTAHLHICIVSGYSTLHDGIIRVADHNKKRTYILRLADVDPEYASDFLEFARPHLLAQRLVKYCTRDPKLKPDEALQKVADDGDLGTLSELREKLNFVPALLDDPAHLDKSILRRSKTLSQIAPAPLGMNRILLTRMVAGPARRVFDRDLIMGLNIEQYDATERELVDCREKFEKEVDTVLLQDEEEDPEVEWQGEGVETSFEDRERHEQPCVQYDAVVLRDVEYKVNDYVFTRPGIDGDTLRSKHASNPAAQSTHAAGNRLWFGRILSLYQPTSGSASKKGKATLDSAKCHVQWYIHSSKTAQGSLGNPLEIFATKLCDDIVLTSVLGRITVKPERITTAYEATEFFCCHVIEEATSQIRSMDWLQRRRIPSDLQLLYDDKCDLCALRRFDDNLNWAVTPGSGGTELIDIHQRFRYHRGDFVYIPHPRGNKPISFNIGQILGWDMDSWGSGDDTNQPKIQVALYRMSPDSPQCLVRSKQERQIDLFDLAGPCLVQVEHSFISEHQLAWLAESSLHFVVKRGSAVPLCPKCSKRLEEHLRTRLEFAREVGSVPIMDLCAGPGGLSHGFTHSHGDIFRGLAAIEKNPKVAETYKANNPDSTVYAADIDRVLKELRVRSLAQNSQIFSIGSVDDIRPIAWLIKRLDLELRNGLLAAGFPCQPFSHANRSRDKNDQDLRLPLVGSVLSWVERSRPRYVVLENVRGLVDKPGAAGPAAAGFGEEGDGDAVREEQAIVKFIFRVLADLGYQVNAGQAGCYGLCQDRIRFIAIAALDGCTLPDLPQPTHAFRTQRTAMKLPNGKVRERCGREDGGAPLFQVKLEDVFPDIRQRFGWGPEVKVPEYAPTILGSGNTSDQSPNWHGRRFHPEESSKIQGFPSNYKFDNLTDAEKRTAAGNAVPPPLSAAIAREITKAMMKDWEMRRAHN